MALGLFPNFRLAKVIALYLFASSFLSVLFKLVHSDRDSWKSDRNKGNSKELRKKLSKKDVQQ